MYDVIERLQNTFDIKHTSGFFRDKTKKDPNKDGPSTYGRVHMTTEDSDVVELQNELLDYGSDNMNDWSAMNFVFALQQYLQKHNVSDASILDARMMLSVCRDVGMSEDMQCKFMKEYMLRIVDCVEKEMI